MWFLIKRGVIASLLLLPLMVLTGCPSSPNSNSVTQPTSTSSLPPLPEPAADARTLTVVVAVIDSLMPEDVDVDGAMPNVTDLATNGTFYRESRSVFSAETIPNHIAMMTGLYPDRNGIPTNNFWDKEFQPDNPDDEDLDNPNELEAFTLFSWIDNQCRLGDDPINPGYRTAATLAKTYLYLVFQGDDADEQSNDAGIRNVEPDRHWDPRTSPAYIGPGSEHTPDNSTGPQAVTDLANSDFIFINLGDLDRSAHAAGENARNASRTTSDAQIGNLVNELKNTGRWEDTVFILASDHGMDYSDVIANPPIGTDVVFNEQGLNSFNNGVSTQPLLDELNSECGYEPMFAVQNGGTNSINVSNLAATALAKQQSLLAARACLLNFDGSNTDDGAPPSCESVVGACYGDLTATVNGENINFAWYANPDVYVGNNLIGALSADSGGRMPDTIKSRHENLGDLVLSVGTGFKFTEPDVSGNPIPGNHGHMPTIHNTIIVSGGADFLKRGEVVDGTSDDHFVRDPAQSENIDVAATVAWLLGLNISDDQFPDADQEKPDYGDGFERNGFDGRVLSEAFTRSTPPSNCGLRLP